MKQLITGFPDVTDRRAVGPEPQSMWCGNFFSAGDQLPEICNRCLRTDQGIVKIEAELLLKGIDQLEPADGSESKVGDEKRCFGYLRRV
jgi:hypothetical protein